MYEKGAVENVEDTKFSISKNALKDVSDVIIQTKTEAENSKTQFVKLKR